MDRGWSSGRLTRLTFANLNLHLFRLAIQALDVLGPWQHPDAASCLVAIALARAQSTGEFDSPRIDEAFRLIEGAVLLGPAEKACLKEAETARIRAGSC
jgi:hypothetical protein